MAGETGIIPAYAGSTTYGGPLPVLRQGSSPRMRGALAKAIHRGPTYGIIPAYAGSTTPSCSPQLSGRDHPRVCGEHRMVRREHG